MGRIDRAGDRRWRVLGALAGLFLISTAGAAQDVPGGPPRLPYAAYAPDDRLSSAGRLVRPESEARRDAAIEREKARIATAQNYAPNPAIWKISDADTTIYIFGTVHSLPPGFRWRNPGLEGVIVRADTLLLESIDGESDDTTFLSGLSQEQTAGMPPLLDRVSHRYRGKLAALQAEMPEETVKALDRMPTWIAAIGVGYIRDMLAGDIAAQGADDWLEKHFRASGRRVEAIENSGSVIANLNAVPERAQRLMLEGVLAAPDRTHADFDGPAHAWARGEMGPDSPLRIFPEQLDPSSALADPLLTQRNRAWVDDLIGRMRNRPGVILFAAGAGHFVGPDSVIELLEKRGVRVERVQ